VPAELSEGHARAIGVALAQAVADPSASLRPPALVAAIDAAHAAEPEATEAFVEQHGSAIVARWGSSAS